MSELTAEVVRDMLDFDAKTGVFTWRRDIWRGPRKGELAGYVYQGRYHRIRLKRVTYPAHRIAWLHYYGHWPEEMIDHIDGDGLNNRISNLRDVQPNINAQNQRKPHKRNKLGVLGVRASRNQFRADISVGDKRFSLGCFSTVEEASAAYINAKRDLHEGCTL